MYRSVSRSSSVSLSTILALVAAAIMIGIVIHCINKNSIYAYLEDRGCTLIRIKWALFGPGWFGERGSTLFRVWYTDQDGNKHHAYCKSGLFSGVYFSEDIIIQKARPSGIAPAETGNTGAKNGRVEPSTVLSPQDKERIRQDILALRGQIALLEERLREPEIQDREN